MAGKPKGLSTGVIAAIAAAVVAAGGGGIVAMNQMQGAPAPAVAVSADPADAAVGVQSATPQKPAQPPAPLVPLQPGTATVSPDGSISFVDESLTFSAILPKGPPDDPIIKYLQADSQAYLDKFKANALADFAERKKQGATVNPWEVDVEWEYTAKAGGIVSLVGSSYEFTGGAHGMTYIDTHIARADTGEQLTLESMLLPGRSPSPALVIAICEALKVQKTEAIGSATIFDEPIVCAGAKANVKLEEAHYALAPSNEADRFGGMYVYFDPYAVGSYAEGSYVLTIPQDVFKEDMRPQYKALFAGSVAPAN